ncbi:MAG: hypothetical protein SPI30_09665 [Prevotella sp.]|nr:hypothetical protein [Prevotella sp.]
MKKVLVISMLLFCFLSSGAQHRRKFDHQRFKAEMKQYIIQEVELTPKEQAAFFPLFEEMHNRQRVCFDKMREYKKKEPQDEKSCMEIIRKIDDLELEQKKIQKEYHSRFLKVISAKKLFSVLKAERRFHRQIFKQIARKKR